LITALHPDHLDVKALAAIKKAGMMIIAPAVIIKKALAALKKATTTIVDPAAVVNAVKVARGTANGQKTARGRWTIEAVPMSNLKRGPAPGRLYHDKGRGNGYVLTYGGMRFYIAVARKVSRKYTP